MKRPTHDSADHEGDDSHPARLLKVSVELAELIANELPDNARAKELSHHLLRSALQCVSTSSAESPTFRTISLYQACEDVCAAFAATLPPSVELQTQLSPGPQTPSFQESALLSLLSTVLKGATTEIGEAGRITLSAKAGEDSWVVEIRSHTTKGELAKVDKERLQECRDFAESLGGHLILWSEPGRRVRLVNLPFQQAPAPLTKQLPPAENQSDSTPKQILLVDDEESIRLVGKAALEKAGHKVLLAKDGREAIALFKKQGHDIDIVLLDLVMPNLGGSQCFEQLKSIDPNIKVVIMSGFTPNTMVNNLIADGCLDFLRKPFDLLELLETLNNALGIEKVERAKPT